MARELPTTLMLTTAAPLRAVMSAKLGAATAAAGEAGEAVEAGCAAGANSDVAARASPCTTPTRPAPVAPRAPMAPAATRASTRRRGVDRILFIADLSSKAAFLAALGRSLKGQT